MNTNVFLAKYYLGDQIEEMSWVRHMHRKE